MFVSNPRIKPTYSDLSHDLSTKLRIIRETAKENQLKAKNKFKECYDKSHNRTYDFNENSMVLLYDSQSKAKKKSLRSSYNGPYKIVQVHDNQTATLQIASTKLQTYHFNLIKTYIVSDGPNVQDGDTCLNSKRGLMNGIESAITWLFGNPSADDATFYSDSINSLVANQKQTQTLMQQQVSIISETITNFNKSLNRMNENVNILDKNLKQLNKMNNDIKDTELNFEITLSNHMLLLIEMTDDVNQLLENYVNDLSLIHNGLINFRTLPP